MIANECFLANWQNWCSLHRAMLGNASVSFYHHIHQGNMPSTFNSTYYTHYYRWKAISNHFGSGESNCNWTAHNVCQLFWCTFLVCSGILCQTKGKKTWLACLSCSLEKYRHTVNVEIYNELQHALVYLIAHYMKWNTRTYLSRASVCEHSLPH